MSDDSPWVRHRGKLPALLVVAVLGAGLLRYRQQVLDWALGKPVFSPPGQVAATGSASSDRRSAPRLSGDTLARARAAFDTYEVIRGHLARDSLEGLEAQSQALVAIIDGLPDSVPQDARLEFMAAKQAALGLGRATDLDAAREAFGSLSRALVALATLEPRLAEGWHLNRCPMTDGYQKWFQRGQVLANPYMGTKMLQCGSAEEWPVASVKPASSAPHVHGDGEPASGSGEIAYYTCPMHPAVRQPTAGQCPICSMDLTPVTRQQVESGTVVVDEVRRQRIGVRTTPAVERPLTLRIRAVGTVEYDESRLVDVNLRMGGWVQKLVVDETGQRVRRGQTLLSLYSPELYAAQLEYLTARRRQAEAKGVLSGSLQRASQQRLRLLGMSAEQVVALEERGEALENVPVFAPASGFVIEKSVVEGARVDAGMRVYRIADLSRVWVDVEVYESDLPFVKPKQPVTVELPHVPGQRHEGEVDYVYPALQGATRTGRVRVVLKNPELALKPDMYANAEIAVDLGPRLVIPDSAVIYTGPRRLVFVDVGEGRLRPTEVKLGVHVEGFYEVTDGLRAGDIVVASGNFLIAAESRIRTATGYWDSTHESH